MNGEDMKDRFSSGTRGIICAEDRTIEPVKACHLETVDGKRIELPYTPKAGEVLRVVED